MKVTSALKKTKVSLSLRRNPRKTTLMKTLKLSFETKKSAKDWLTQQISMSLVMSGKLRAQLRVEWRLLNQRQSV